MRRTQRLRVLTLHECGVAPTYAPMISTWPLADFHWDPTHASRVKQPKPSPLGCFTLGPGTGCRGPCEKSASRVVSRGLCVSGRATPEAPGSCRASQGPPSAVPPRMEDHQVQDHGERERIRRYRCVVPKSRVRVWDILCIKLRVHTVQFQCRFDCVFLYFDSVNLTDEPPATSHCAAIQGRAQHWTRL